MPIIICECRDCDYHITLPNEGDAYKEQCCNNEIEIGWDDEIPRCYSYSNKENL